ncbi:hypothetical protein [Legionella brunensis]|uniref:Uncharacterized protein n=1 Tax=Legionella brunensis TaxID=29422 RepID=A0A0W0SSQ3_9GAMM|nr:hypothetical protein [Legionella brunensis]KTC86284.1 hypothetical protein Lbru_0778 [Legionella brunensis]
MSSRKELRKSIDQLEVKIQMERGRLTEHQLYFRRLKERNRYLLLALLIPTFIAGWQEGKMAAEKKEGRVKSFAKFMLGTALATVRTQKLLK